MRLIHRVLLLLVLLPCQGCYFWYGWSRLKPDCEKGHASACGVIAMHGTLEAFPEITTDADRHHYGVLEGVAHEKDCAKWEAEHFSKSYCQLAAQAYFHWGAVGAEVQKAIGMAREGCDQDPFSPEACELLGAAHWYGYGLEEDRATAAALFTKACSVPRSSGCYGKTHADLASYHTPYGFEVPTERDRLERARSLVAKGEASPAQRILLDLSGEQTPEPVRSQARTLLAENAENAGRLRLAEIGKLRAEGKRVEALSLARSFEEPSWPAAIRKEGEAQRDAIAEERWNAEVAGLAQQRHYVPAVRAAAALSCALPEGHAVAVRAQELSTQAAAFHLAAAEQQQNAGRAASALFHRQLAAWMGTGTTEQYSPLLNQARLSPVFQSPGCEWVQSALGHRGGTAVLLTGKLVCEHGEAHLRRSERISWDEAVPFKVEKWVDEPVTKKESYSCKQVSYSGGPGGQTRYYDAQCTREVRTTERVLKTVTDYRMEPRAGTREVDQRHLLVRIRGTVRPDWPGAREIPLSIEEEVRDEAVTSPKPGDERQFGPTTLAELEKRAMERAGQSFQAALEPIAAEKATRALQAFREAAKGSDLEATDEAALTALLWNAAPDDPAAWLRQRWALEPDEIHLALEGDLARPAEK